MAATCPASDILIYKEGPCACNGLFRAFEGPAIWRGKGCYSSTTSSNTLFSRNVCVCVFAKGFLDFGVRAPHNIVFCTTLNRQTIRFSIKGGNLSEFSKVSQQNQKAFWTQFIISEGSQCTF